MKATSFEQLKTMLKSISLTVFNRVGSLAAKLDRTNETADRADTNSKIALNGIKEIDTKMDKENPSGTGSFSLNRKEGTEIGENSIAMGEESNASGDESVAIGSYASANGYESIAIGGSNRGNYTLAIGNYAKAYGDRSVAVGTSSTAGDASRNFETVAVGCDVWAYGGGSVGIGRQLRIKVKDQTVIGMWNKQEEPADPSKPERGKYAFIFGNGSDEDNRSNAFTIDWNGNAWFQGEVYVGGEEQDNGSAKLVKNGDESITLKSPDGSLFTISVNNDGTLSAAKITE